MYGRQEGRVGTGRIVLVQERVIDASLRGGLSDGEGGEEGVQEGEDDHWEGGRGGRSLLG